MKNAEELLKELTLEEPPDDAELLRYSNEFWRQAVTSVEGAYSLDKEPEPIPDLTLLNPTLSLPLYGTSIALTGRYVLGVNMKGKKYKSDPNSTVLFVGFQATGTLGRLILDGRESVRILGEYKPVRARIERIEGFSAHADQKELCDWLRTCAAKPRRVFITHGEPDAAFGLSRAIRATLSWEAYIPSYKEEITLN